jgi:multidrug efflux pump subunit AcrA (membrane-fusion protein)
MTTPITPRPSMRTTVGPVGVAAPMPGVVVSHPAKAGDDPGAIVFLLRIEGEARACKTTSELAILIANETRKLTRARQIFVLGRTARGAFQVEAVSALAKVDRNVPLIQWIERTVERLAADAGLDDLREFVLHAYCEPADPTASTYPLREALWFPLVERAGGAFAGVLLVRDEPWKPSDSVLARRLSVTYAQAWYWLATARTVRPRLQFNRTRTALGALLVACLALMPVSLTTLAPLEIGPRDQTMVTAPIDGVIEEIPVAPNAVVSVGQTLLRFSDISLRNKLAVAEREVQVADARVKKTMLMAVNDIRGRHELALAQAELSVKTAERDYARELLERANVTALAAGVVVFGDKRDLIGKPVSVGEKIMEIADPNRVEIRIDVPVGDAIILKGQARAKVFLDSDPLRPIEATILRSDYQAKPRDNGVLAFRVIAELAEKDLPPPRLGLRGTAQLYGDRVPVIYTLLRRPIAALRQWTGL